MDYLPASVQKVLEGRIDPQSQHLVEAYSQHFLVALTLLAFLLSYLTASVLLGLEAFTAGFMVLLLTTVPPWPFLNRYPIKFLPVRRQKTA